MGPPESQIQSDESLGIFVVPDDSESEAASTTTEPQRGRTGLAIPCSYLIPACQNFLRCKPLYNPEETLSDRCKAFFSWEGFGPEPNDIPAILVISTIHQRLLWTPLTLHMRRLLWPTLVAVWNVANKIKLPAG